MALPLQGTRTAERSCRHPERCRRLARRHTLEVCLAGKRHTRPQWCMGPQRMGPQWCMGSTRSTTTPCRPAASTWRRRGNDAAFAASAAASSGGSGCRLGRVRLQPTCAATGGAPRESHDNEVELAPRVVQVGLLVHHEAVGEHLREQLEREDRKVDPLAAIDKPRLARVWLVERLLPRHRHAVADDRYEDDRVERSRFDEADRCAHGGWRLVCVYSPATRCSHAER